MAKLAVGPIPLYHQLEKEILGRIEAGEFPAGEPLPTEEQFCLIYGVSRITVRKALDILLQQGVIVRRRGVGSFVAERQEGVHSVHLGGSLDQFLRSAYRLTPKVVSLAPVRASNEVALGFGLKKGTQILRLELITSSEDGPLGHCEFLFPPSLIGVLTKEHITSSEPIVQIVERLMGVRVARACQIIEPGLAGAATAKFLGIRPEEPVLCAQRMYYTSSGKPIEIARVRYHPSRYRYQVELRAKPHFV